MDCRQLYFSFNGEAPSLPPARFFLPDGFSRYSYDCTIEELNSAGYIGPVEIIEGDENTVVEWCCEDRCFKCREATEEEKKNISNDVSVRQWIKNKLKEKLNINSEEYKLYSDYYISELLQYYASLESLLTRKDRLSYTDIPSEPNTLYKLQSDFVEAYNKHFNDKLLADIKEQYEKYGIINDVSPVFKKYFRVDPSWVKGSEPLPNWFEVY